jgi:hypothetical protein
MEVPCTMLPQWSGGGFENGPHRLTTKLQSQPQCISRQPECDYRAGAGSGSSSQPLNDGMQCCLEGSLLGVCGVKDNSKRRKTGKILLCVITLSRGMRHALIRAPKFLGAMVWNLLLVMSCPWLGRFCCDWQIDILSSVHRSVIGSSRNKP